MGNPTGYSQKQDQETDVKQDPSTPELSLGESRVRTTFNPSRIDYVSQLKQAGAAFIDLINQAASNPVWDDNTLGEWRRLKALAMTEIESGTSWAVKAATISK